MAKHDAIIRLSLILRKIRSKPSSFDDIYDFLMMEGDISSYDFDISKRTFQRDIEDIAKIFDAEIKYDYSRKVYYISEESPINNRLMEAFDTFSALNSKERIPDILHFENRKPLGMDNLHGIIHAVKNNYKLKFYYQKYWEEEKHSRTVAPYALKEFNHRWYLIALNEEDQKFKIFGLDRVSELSITKLKFTSTSFNVQEYFRHCFGIIRPDGEDDKAEKVILEFDAFKGKYIKSLPLHHSQRILIDNEEVLKVELEVYLTHDFKMEILSHGHDVKVLEPNIFKEEIGNSLAENIKYYS